MKNIIKKDVGILCKMQCKDCPLLSQIQNIAGTFADAVEYIKNFSDDFLNRMLKTAASDESIQSSLITLIDYFIKILENMEKKKGDSVKGTDKDR